MQDAPLGLRGFRRRVIRSAALLLAVGNLVLLVVFATTDRMAPLALGLMVASIAVHLLVAITAGRNWSPGDLTSLGYVSLNMAFVAVGVSTAELPTTDAAWFSLVPMGLAAVMFHGRRLTAFTGASLAALVGAFVVGPGALPAVLLPRVLALATFVLGLRVVVARVEIALAEAEEANTVLSQQVTQAQEVNQRLVELDRIKDDFVSIASHELRTPLALIVGLSQTINHRWDLLDDAQRRDLVMRVEEHARSLEGIVSTVLDVARIDRGNLRAELAAVEVGDLVEASLSRMAVLLRHHDVRVDIAPGSVAMADRALLDRVIDNLLSNAARHTPSGTAVAVRVRAGADVVRVEVQDHGPGIPAKELARLGERFFRAEDADRRTRDGVGLGLALVVDVLEQLGTRLEIASTVGRGTTFAFDLHRRHEYAEELVADDPAADRAGPVVQPA